MAVIPHTLCFSLFPQLKINLKGHHFDNEVIEAESQAVLNTLTEHYFPDAFKKNGKSARYNAYAPKGTTLKVTVATKPKVSFDQMAAPVSEIMDGLCISSFSLISLQADQNYFVIRFLQCCIKC
jgi:hypothetical protein